MINQHFQRALLVGGLVLLQLGTINAQSSRPRRVKQAAKPAEEPLLRPEPKPSPTARSNPNAPLISVQPVKPVINTTASGNTSNAFLLLQQKQFAAAAKEAKSVASNYPKDPEAWKIAGFAELNLKQYTEAASDLEKAL
ncbi:MAG: hypothetical protein ABI923_13470, partial [bacterium]